MKIAILGTGRMGTLVQALATDQKFATVTASKVGDLDLTDVDVCIDFSHASQVLKLVERCAKEGVPLVIGSTGWERDFDAVKKIVLESSIGCVYSSNYSIGVFLVEQLLQSLSQLLEKVPEPEFEIAIHEMHHSKKVDSPSGTALQLVKQLSQKPVAISSTRCGTLIGTHTVLFDAVEDTIELTHRAKSRSSFARGALQAAQWVRGNTGFYTFQELLRKHYGI